MLLLCVLAALIGCEDMDTIMPSSGNYKIDFKVSGVSLDDCTFIKSSDVIKPVFDNPVLDDPDITSLVIFIRNSGGEINGSKVMYKLDTTVTADNNSNSKNSTTGSQDNKNSTSNSQDNKVTNTGNNDSDTIKNDEKKSNDNSDDEDDETVSEENDSDNNSDTESINNYVKIDNTLVIPVANMDKLPSYPMLKDLNTGWYTMVYQVMSGKDYLFKSDKNFFYLADKNFSFNDVHVHLSGVMTDSQYIPKDTVIMLEAKLEFDEIFEPYIIWYNGKKIIGQGKYSEGGGQLLWSTPNQSAFLLLRAEALPFSDNRQGKAGYSRQVSLPISSKGADFILLSKDSGDVTRLYLFEGNLNDSLAPSTKERSIKPEVSTYWMSANGHYGPASGSGQNYSLPDISLSGDGNKAGEFIFRFKPLNDGVVFAAQFGTSSDVLMKLSYEKSKLILALKADDNTVSQKKDISPKDAFISAKVKFVIYQERLEAKLLLFEEFGADKEINIKPIFINTSLSGDIQINLGSKDETNSKTSDPSSTKTTQSNGVNNSTPEKKAVVKKPEYTAIWDEFAVVTVLSEVKASETKTDEKEIITENEKINPKEEITQNTGEYQNEASKKTSTEAVKEVPRESSKEVPEDVSEEGSKEVVIELSKKSDNQILPSF